MERREFLKASTALGAAPARVNQDLSPERLVDVAVNVRDRGAKGDGITDDTLVIQAALDSGSKRVYVPAGNYIVSTLVIRSNTELYGDGKNATTFVHKRASNLSVIRNNGPTKNVTLSAFAINGMSASQSKGNHCGVTLDDAASKCNINDVFIEDIADWGFCITGHDISLRNCIGANITGSTGPHAVRAAFLLGSSRPPKSVSSIFLDDCVAKDCPTAYTDGFIIENGSNVMVINCRVKDIAYTGFKIKTSNTQVVNCYAENCLTGYQTQGPLRQLSFIGNMAFRNRGAGFQFNQNDPANNSAGWVITNNSAIENGQSVSAGTRYGFAFENADSCKTDGLLFANNLAIDNQALPTQARGISFGKSGIYSNVLIGGNFCKGNSVDILYGNSLQMNSTLRTWNAGGNTGSYPTSTYRFNFWTDSLLANTAIALLKDCAGGRGYTVPKAGFVYCLSARATSPVKTGSATFSIRVNGNSVSEFQCVLDSKAPTFKLIEAPAFAYKFGAGDVITISCGGNAMFAGNENSGFDVAVEVCY